jgi:NhaP-type Na+/H+ or K+/H+ antiporter
VRDWAADLHLMYLVAGTMALGLALVSRRIRRWPVSEPLLALVAGVVIGPVVLGLVRVDEPVLQPLLLESTRLLLAGSVMAAALRFPASSLRAVLRPVLILLAVVMPAAALVVGAAAFWLGLPLGLAAVLGACLSPTDPVLAAAVVSGEPAERDLPGRLRSTLSMESGANDGLALPLVAVAVAIVLPGGTGDVVLRLGWEVGGAVLIGVVLGAATAWAVRRVTSEGSMAKGPELVLTLLLALAVLGAARTASVSGVLAVFLAGLAYNHGVPSSERSPQDSVDEAVNRYAVLPLFVLLGIILPWSSWQALGWTAVVFAAAVLLVRRIPLVVAVARPARLESREALFMGWFGPIGVSGLFYIAYSMDQGVSDPRLFALGTLAVTVSVVAFGITGSPFRDLYARRTRP